jgi:hypothetical protein
MTAAPPRNCSPRYDRCFSQKDALPGMTATPLKKLDINPPLKKLESQIKQLILKKTCA